MDEITESLSLTNLNLYILAKLVELGTVVHQVLVVSDIVDEVDATHLTFIGAEGRIFPIHTAVHRGHVYLGPTREIDVH